MADEYDDSEQLLLIINKMKMKQLHVAFNVANWNRPKKQIKKQISVTASNTLANRIGREFNILKILMIAVANGFNKWFSNKQINIVI